MKKYLKILAWASAGIGILMMLLGSIAVLNDNHFLGHFWSSFFYPAYNFIQLGIFFLVATMVIKEKE
jgi:hypothetical protein